MTIIEMQRNNREKGKRIEKRKMSEGGRERERRRRRRRDR
jgi:hypothetical protein